ncbi:hypothetical protein BJX70DRAFT_367304 [Aspergillus crustosus]
MSLLTLPNELLHTLLDPYLYERDTKENHSSALLWASRHGHLPPARKSLAAGADPNTFMTTDEESLHWACNKGHSEIVALVLAATRIEPDLVSARG